MAAEPQFLSVVNSNLLWTTLTAICINPMKPSRNPVNVITEVQPSNWT